MHWCKCFGILVDGQGEGGVEIAVIADIARQRRIGKAKLTTDCTDNADQE